MVTRKQPAKSKAKTVSFAAFDLSKGDVGLFLIAVKPSDIFKYSRVSRAEEDPEEGFQRKLDIHRVKKIAEYINDGKVVPGAIIISAQDDERIAFDKTSNTINFPNEEGFFLVIDGQHRLYGSLKAEQDFSCNVTIPICILTKISAVDEVQYFIDINGNQKGVSKSLRIELTKFLVEEDSIDDIRLRLFKEMNSDVDSPLFGHLSTTKGKIGSISHVPFKAAFDRILVKDPLKKLSFEQKKKLINNYLAGVLANLEEVDEGRRLYQSVFFQAIFRIFIQVCEAALMYERKYNEEAFKRVFSFLQSINFELHSGSNEEAISSLSKDMSHFLDISLTNSAISDDLL